MKHILFRNALKFIHQKPSIVPQVNSILLSRGRGVYLVLKEVFQLIKKDKNSLKIFTKTFEKKLKILKKCVHEEHLQNVLVDLNNLLKMAFAGKITQNEMKRVEQIHQIVLSALYYYFPPPSDVEKGWHNFNFLPTKNNPYLEHYYFQSKGLAPLWLIEKHIKPRSNISLLKSDYEYYIYNAIHNDAEQITLSEKNLEAQNSCSTLSSVSTEFANLSPQNSFTTESNSSSRSIQTALERRYRFFPSSRRYTKDKNFIEIVNWVSTELQKKEGKHFLAVGTGKVRVNGIKEMIIDGIAVVTFYGSLLEGSRETSPYYHGPEFLFISEYDLIEVNAKAFSEQKAKELPWDKLIYLLPTQHSKQELIYKLELAWKNSLISEERLRTVEHNIHTYETFVQKHIKTENIQSPDNSLRQRLNIARTG